MKNKRILATAILIGLSTLEAQDFSSLSIQVQPNDSRIRIMNISPKFHNGMQLQTNKKYHILIDKKGYKSINRWITLNKDNNLSFTLNHLPQKNFIEKIFGSYSSKTKAYNYRKDIKSSYYNINKSLIRQFRMALNLGNFKLAKEMINTGVNVNIRFSSGMTPLHIASARGNLDMVKYLISHGADTSAMDKDYAVPAFVSTQIGHKNITSYLLNHEQKFNNEKLENKIQLAIISNDIKTFKKIFQTTNINISMFGKKRALHSAAQSKRYEMVKYLIEKGANINQLDVAGISPLHEAIKSHSPKIVRLLVDKGAYVGITDTFGRTSMSLYSEHMQDTPLRGYLNQKLRDEQVSRSIIQGEIKKETKAFNTWLNS